jgi:YD repeat-containing protein
LAYKGDGSRTSFTYDAANRLLQRYSLKPNNDVVKGVGYVYDSGNNRTSMLDAAGIRTTWAYDSSYQLTAEQRTAAEGFDNAFQYDPVGNRHVKNESGALTTFVYDVANQLVTSRDAGGISTYTFDASGNQQIVVHADGTRTTNTWNYENQTTLTVLPSGVRVTSVYNADNRRVRKEA